MRESEDTAPAFTVISAVHNVTRYLDEFFESLREQSLGLDRLEVLLVDDGSTDDSLVRCRAFAAEHPDSVRVLTQPNAGQASARNLGLSEARGRWVTFADPDDTLDPAYFAEVAACLSRDDFANAAMLSASIIVHSESTGLREDRHPLNGKFRQGNAVFDLDNDPEAIQMSAATAFFRLDRIAAASLRFDERIRPTFEDCAFVATYLLAAPRPTLGVVATAKYYYRKRLDGSSTLERSGADPAKYTVVPRLGHLALLERAASRGNVPRWLQNMVVYDLAWYLAADVGVQSATGALADEVVAEFHRLVAEIRALIDDTAIDEFSIMPISGDIRFALRYGFGSAPTPITVRIDDADTARRLVRLRYRFAGDAPHEELLIDGARAIPAHAKYRSIEFYRRVVARERILWSPSGDAVEISLNGERMPLQPDEDSREDGAPARRWVRAVLSKAAAFEAAISLAMRSPLVRRYRGSWVFMDRDQDAGDSAEEMYRYVKQHHAHIRCYFVLRRDSADWGRLKRDGVRLVPYGSWRWQLLMQCAAHLASSHADRYVTRPLDPSRFGSPPWRFTFLQHGVIKDDLSRWLNPKRIDLLVTSSEAEYESIVADGTPYVLTSKEVKLTGLPRFDALRRKRDATPAEHRRLILIAPTWRLGLVGDADSSATDRKPKAGFAESAYHREWTALLASPDLAATAESHGLELVFMPHPNMGAYLREFTLPDAVRIARHDADDIQSLLAQARLLVTDYSSVAFNAAVLGVPTAYFQFDRDDFYSGAHPGRSGYFDYERDGFGPVSTSTEGVASAVAGLLEAPDSALYYAERATRAIAFHDARNSQRVFEAMARLDEPWRPEPRSPEPVP